MLSVVKPLCRRRALGALFLVCVGVAPAVAQEIGLGISDAWVRAMPPGQRMTAAYLTLHNTTAAPITVTGVHSPRGEASLHETRVVDGRSTMRPAGPLEVPAGGSLALEPGALHIMLMGLNTTPGVGETLPLCVVSTAGEVCADLPVQRGPSTPTGASGVHRH